MPKCPKCGSFVGESEEKCPSCFTPLTHAAREEGPELVDKVVNSEYWIAAVRKIPPLIDDEEKANVEYEEFANLLELAGARYSADVVRRQIAAVEKGHAQLLKSIQERMKRIS
jgi:hypothetical protein